jgi:hypothetical protein
MNQKKLNPSESELRNSAYDWIHKLDDYTEEAVPKGWLTAKQICDLKGITIGQAEGLIRRMVRSKEWVSKKFTIRSGGAGIKKVMHYKGK